MDYQIALIRGDGIGPEIVDSAVRVLEKIGGKYGHNFRCTPYLAGGCAIDQTGVPLPEETVAGCLASDSVLLGAVGGPKWDKNPAGLRPEKALLGLRAAMGLYTNLRPAKLYPALAGDCPLRPDIVANGFDMVIVRELTGGIYFGERGRREGKYGPEAYDTEAYSVMEVERIARVAFETARKRRKHVISIDKANVLETSRLWRETAQRVAREYSEVAVDYMFVDNAAMQIIRQPAYFDVIVTENMFGDILTDEASVISGSLGMLSSASVGAEVALFEPIHGSYPQAAGKNIANPMATILSAAMLLEHLGLDAEGRAVRRAVDRALAEGVVTEDLAAPGEKARSTSEVGDYVASQI